LIIATQDETKHDDTLHQVLERARERNIRSSPSKLQLKIPEVKYLGHIVSHEGIHPSPDRVEAIVKMPKPEDHGGVQRLLGMIKYLAEFIPHESDITAPLRELLKKETQWTWTHEHDNALQEIKETLTADLVLTFYDVHKETVIQADASQTGLGACLLQGGRPVAYASRALTQTEQMYAQIEKEMLSIVFVCRKFHPFIYGKTVRVQTDHKPLEIISRKPLCKAPPRLQRMLLQVQRYDLTVEYIPGKNMLVVDALSRAHLNVPDDADVNLQDDVEVMVHSFTDALPVGQSQQNGTNDPSYYRRPRSSAAYSCY
jgi:hypothetical protein